MGSSRTEELSLLDDELIHLGAISSCTFPLRLHFAREGGLYSMRAPV